VKEAHEFGLGSAAATTEKNFKSRWGLWVSHVCQGQEFSFENNQGNIRRSQDLLLIVEIIQSGIAFQWDMQSRVHSDCSLTGRAGKTTMLDLGT